MSRIDQLIEDAKQAVQSPADLEAQRRSFAYGNAKTENAKVTREMVDRAAERHTRKA